MTRLYHKTFRGGRRRLIGRACVWLTVLIPACSPPSVLITPVTTGRAVREKTIRSGPWMSPKIAIIDLDGVMTNSRGIEVLSDGEHPVSLLKEKLDAARRDRRVRAVILRINSPGGTVTASEIMHHEIQSFREKTHKPVIAVMMDVAASGGYYVACACDEIIAHRSTVTGSIGVIMQLFDVTGTMSKIGVAPNVIKSGPYKAAGSPFEQMSPEDRAIFQSMIDDMYSEFVRVVNEGRPELTEEAVRKLADGRVYTAPQALEAGLIDRIGTIDDAIDVARKKTGIGYARLVLYDRPYQHVPNYYARQPSAPEINLLNVNLAFPRTNHGARFMYLWAPEWN